MSFKVLIVDDEPAISISLRFLMEKEGFLVETASDGQEALFKASQFKPHLVLLDFMMPEINGLAVCKTLKTFENPPKVLFLSAKGRTDDIEKAKEAGADAYMVKPFAIAEVLSQAHALLETVAIL